MTLNIEVSTELEARIEEAARRSGLDKAEIVRLALEEKFNLTAPIRNPPFEARIIATNLPVPDRSREHSWLEKHRDEYAGQWVVLDGDNLIAAGFEGKEVAKKVRELGINSTYLAFVEGSDQPQ